MKLRALLTSTLVLSRQTFTMFTIFSLFLLLNLAVFVHSQYPLSPQSFPQFLAIPIPPGSAFRFAYPPRYNQAYSPYNVPFYPPPPPLASPSSAPSVCKTDKPARLDFKECQQFQPKEEDKKMKEEKTKECFKDVNVNENSTLEELNPTLQNSVNECLLRKKELLNDAGKFQFDKALEKLKEKKLPEDKQKKLEEAHYECKISSEAASSTSSGPLATSQAYFRCMDFHIATICNIKKYNPNPQPGAEPPPVSGLELDILSQSL